MPEVTGFDQIIEVIEHLGTMVQRSGLCTLMADNIFYQEH